MNNNNNDNLYENDTYFVRVGISIDYEGPTKERSIYQVVNKLTEVIEREDFALPSAIEHANYLHEALEKVQQNTSAVVTH